jgi:putative tryptophan/tyrosine transport system substrate-binding protein
MLRRDFIVLLGGVAVSWPLAARAQQGARPVIGFMSGRAPDDSQHLLEAFRRGLRDEGFGEGENVTIEFRWARGDYSKLAGLAADLVARQVKVLVAVGGEPSAQSAKRATQTIPIVFGMGGDPVKSGLVASFNKPGGNATGLTLLSSLLEPKRLSILRELVPGAPLIGVLINPKNTPATIQLQQIEAAARAIGQRYVVANASNDSEIEGAFALFARQKASALLVAADPYFDTRRDRIVAFAQQSRLPAIYQFREYAVTGGLLSYGVSITDVYRQFGQLTAKILKGAKPSDLPVQQPTKFELVINMKTAKSLGIEISSNLLSIADEVLE